MIGMDELSVGESGTVQQMERGSVLTGYGLCVGAEVECLFQAPFFGMKAYQVQGTMLAVRKQDANTVRITREGERKMQTQGKEKARP